MDNSAELLLDDYNHYRFQTNNIHKLKAKGKRIVSLGRKKLPAFVDLHRWCAEKGIDARHWLCSLFEVRHWLFAPPLHQLKSPKHLRRYPTTGSMPAYQKRLAEQRRNHLHATNRVFDPNRDINAASETLKRRYLSVGAPERCMEKMDSETYGFHPRSPVCEGCPLQQSCAVQLRSKVRFDIMALRRGEITARQAQAVVYYGRCN